MTIDDGGVSLAGLEDAIVVEYVNGEALAYRSTNERKCIEYRDRLPSVDDS